MKVELPSPSGEARLATEPHWRRLLHGIGANLLGKAWIILGQVITVPVLLSVWGPERYGLFVMVSAIPTYAVLSDFGFGSAAAVRMTQLVALGQKDEALRVFQSIAVLINAILIVMLAASFATFAVLPSVAHLLGFGRLDSDVCWAFLLMMVFSAIILEMYVVATGFRSTGRYARGTILLDLSMPLETATLLIAAVTTRSFAVCAATQVAVRAIALVLYYARLRIDEPWLRLGWSKASWAIIRYLTKPSLANFALPFAQAMSAQGVILTVGIAFGPAAVSTLSVVRTFTRLPLQLVSVLTRASQPEMTLAHALSRKGLMARLTALNLAVTLLVFAPFILASPWGGDLIRLVGRGRLSMEPGFYTTMEIVAAVQATWATIAMFLLAENNLQKIVPWCLAAGVAAAMAPLVFHTRINLTGLAAILGCLDVVVLVAAAWIWWRGSGLSLSDFAGLVRNPVGLFSGAAAEETTL